MKTILRNALAAILLLTRTAHGEAMLQYFNTSWTEITRKMPELAEAGYSSLWLPPPTKASGGLSVGYDLWDPFDLGGKDQRGSVRTRYGTEAELLELVNTAHRFGIRVYFDNIMNHRAFDIPGYNENTPVDLYPGMVPEDFHLRRTQEGFYRKWDNTRDWNSAWQVQNLGLADLIDIAQEPGTINLNHGEYEGAMSPKIRFIRDLDRPEQYAHDKDGNYIGFGGLLRLARDPANLGPSATDQQAKDWAKAYLQTNSNIYAEYVEDYLSRAARWLMERTKADGLRLDAVKHIRADFFGATYGSDKDTSDYGYLGQVQQQFNLTRGFSDANHRDTVFDTEVPRDDAMVFGEHLGEPPGYGPYIDSGMRLIDNPLRTEFNNRLGNPWTGLTGFDQPGAGGFAPGVCVMHAQSHDSDFAARRELQHAMYFTRAGLGLLYTDGNYQAETLGESGGAFPRHSNTAFLGQWGDVRVPNLLHIHNQFARGDQVGRWSDQDVVIYERRDKRENGSMNDADGTTLLFMLNDDYSTGHGRNFDSGFNSGDYLFNYSSYGGGFYKYAWEIENGSTVIPAGGYFAFSWKNPDPSMLWNNGGGRPITFYQNGAEVGTLTVSRRDGPNGDANFNGDVLPAESRPIVANSNSSDYAYTAELPRVTDGSSLRIVARVDGSAENVLFKLDGGIDLNGTRPASTNVNMPNNDPVNRDNPPALSWDMFLGYEQPTFQKRIHPELFAAIDTGARNQTGSAGAETYTTTGVDPQNQGAGAKFVDGDTAAFLYHDPAATVEGQPFTHWNSANRTLWAKANALDSDVYKMFVYYSADSSSFPEGAGGEGIGSTRVVEMTQHAGGEWWASTAMPADFIEDKSYYKIGIHKESAPSWFPGSPGAVNRKTNMMTQFAIEGFNTDNVTFFPHFDYATDAQGNQLTATGLEEGFHVLRARAFLSRPGKSSIYNTFTQTFYYDTERPGGEIRFPSQDNETVGGSSYGVVVRTDRSVTEVWYHISDEDPTNDDSSTGSRNGNGGGFEPFTDSNRNGTRDAGENYEDLNNNGIWDDSLTESWVRATEVTPSLNITPSNPSHTREWRFNYVNIPPPGGAQATIRVRLREISSSGYSDFALDDTAGHFTTLTRTVDPSGPNERMFIAFPQSDGESVGDDYVMRVFFSKSIADGLSETELINRFLIRIGSNESGDAGIAQDRGDYQIEWNATTDYHALTYNLPNLYNDQPDYLHRIHVVHDRPVGQSDFEASRLVRAVPVTTPRVLIVTPPELGSDGRPYEIILPDVASPTPEERQTIIRVATNLDATDVQIGFVDTRGTTINTPTVSEQGNSKIWDFPWSNLAEGRYRFTASVTSPGGQAEAARNATIVFRQIVDSNETDEDDDDDGLRDGDESTTPVLPNQSIDGIQPPAKPNPEQWTNGEVHIYYAYGKSNPLSPDSDGDGLPDGLEVGWRIADNPPTDPAANTDGDDFPNFIGDLDPPFYNTLDNLGSVPGVNSASEGGDRARQLVGSTTDPSNPDSDGDGLSDGIEDANRNGWVDGDGETIDPTWNPWLARNWPNGVMDPGETWTETDPNNPDTDGDGLPDGFREDRDFNGLIGGDANSNRIYDAGEAWTETNPLDSDTDGDGLPDGWETNNGLDALDNGTDNLATSTPDDGDPDMGADGDPDEDGFTNAQELVNQTHPLVDDTLPPLPANSIIIGPGSAETFGATTNDNAFTDWTIDDLLVLDEYQGNGTNNQGGDLYRGWDGFDNSRDLVAFYFRDGGGDGKLYFRADLHDLAPFAEEGNLDLYVVIDTGNPAVGESNLPDDVDTRTNMRWEAVVAVYQTNNGAVYIDTDSGNNTTAIAQDLFSNGVVRRDQSATNGFGLAYFNSELDAMEFSISRNALLDAGWNGNPESLNFQVFTTRDGTSNNPVGLGDIGGRSDIRDSIYDDSIASDYWRDQSNIGGSGSVLYGWFGRSAANDRGKRAKVGLVTHGNQPIKPGNEIMDLVNDDQGAGFYRLVDAHGAYHAPLTLHITATLASAIQWASVDPALTKPWRDGPSLNANISGLMADGTISLPATTYADHILPFTTQQFTTANVTVASETLTAIYGISPSSRVFWPAERVLDDESLAQISAMGFTHTVADQMRHIFKWFGRDSAYGESGYRINEVNGTRLFVINDSASGFRFQNHDNGLNFALREVLSRRARGATQDQVLLLASDWEDFANKTQADAYERNLRWLANRPWIELITLDDIANGEVDLSQPPDGIGDNWGTVNHGNGLNLTLTAKDFIDHATQENYSHWYDGQSGREQGLSPTVFDIRPGFPLPSAFGRLGFGGIIDDAWNQVAAATTAGPASLGRATTGSAMFVTGFHNQPNSDLSKYSTGDYIYPDTSYNTLSDFTRRAQSAARHAALYRRADLWAAAPPSTTTATAEDVDLDGENEYLIANDRVLAIFEVMGARLVAGFARNTQTGSVYQLIGTQPAFPGSDNELEGTSNVANGAVAAHRTSGFKDWFANGSGGGSSEYVNAAHTVTSAGPNGWTFRSPGGHVLKTVTLATGSPRLNADYQLSGDVNKLYVRMGLSPDLQSLLVRGQENLLVMRDATKGRFFLENSHAEPVATTLRYNPTLAAVNNAAVDDNPSGGSQWDTLNMRNQALTQQVELENISGQTSFSIVLGMETASTDFDGDQLPDWWENRNNLDSDDDGSVAIVNGPDGDPDLDGYSNFVEWLMGMNPNSRDASSFPKLGMSPDANGFRLSFPTLPARRYQVETTTTISANEWLPYGNPLITTPTDAPGTFKIVIPRADPKRFYRMTVTAAPDLSPVGNP